MATIQIDIPDEFVPRVLDAFAIRFGYVDQATNGTKQQFAKKQLAGMVKRVVWDVEKQQAEQAAQAALSPPTPIEVT